MPGFLVEGHSGPDVRGHVGDRHEDAPTPGSRFAVHRIVEVAGVVAVNGHEAKAPQIDASLDVAAAYASRQACRFGLGFPGPLVRHLVGSDRDIDPHPGQHPGSEHLFDDPDRGVPPGRRLRDSRDDVVAIACFRDPVRRHEHVVVNPRIVRAHERDAAFAPEASHHRRDAPLDDFDQRAFAATVATHLHDPGYHAVAVHQRPHLIGREEQVRARVVGTDEPEPVSMSDDAPGDEIHARNQAELVPAVANDLAVSLHGVQPPLQRLVRGLGAEPMRLGDAPERDGHSASSEEFDQGAAFREICDTGTAAASVLPAGTWRFR